MSVNVVHCIRCSRCGILYIGETKRRLGDCFMEHLRSVRKKRQHLLFANHFNSHSLGDMSILALLQCHNDATQKLEKLTESNGRLSRIILILFSLFPLILMVPVFYVGNGYTCYANLSN
eukprot:g45441.t1